MHPPARDSRPYLRERRSSGMMRTTQAGLGLRLMLVALLLAGSSGMRAPGAQSQKQREHPLLVAYFPQWGLHSEPKYTVRQLAQSGGAAQLDQLNYAQGSPKDGACSLADPQADIGYAFPADESVDGRDDSPTSAFRGNFHQLEELKHRYPHLKVLISLEGSAQFFANDALPEHRQSFVTSCMKLFIEGRFAPGVHKPGIFDGIDLDWEYPKAGEAENYIGLLREFRRQLDAYKPGLQLTVAVGPSPRMYPGVAMTEVSRYVDRIGVMNYDYAGPWSKTTSMIAPLYPSSDDPTAGGSVDGSLQQYQDAGIAPGKLLMGLPFYGYGWEQVEKGNDGLYQQGQPIHEDKPYNYVAGLMAHSVTHRVPQSQAPWIYDGNTFWTYDDAVSIAYKVDYAQHHRLGGMMVWELSGDDASGTLLRAAYTQLTHPEVHGAGLGEGVEPAATESSAAMGGRKDR